MDTILVVNAGSSSVKFQVFETDGKSALKRLIKGQMDGIGVRPRLRAAASDGARLIDAAYAPERVGDAAAALALAGAWLRETQQLGTPQTWLPAPSCFRPVTEHMTDRHHLPLKNQS